MTTWLPKWLYLSRNDIEIEWQQCEEEGRDLSSVAAEFDRVRSLDLDDPAHQPAAEALLDRTAQLPLRPDFRYVEPSDLERIQAERQGNVEMTRRVAPADLADKMHGAWLGRVCGCLLGKPVEGWRRPRMNGYLQDTGRWPLNDYFTRRVPEPVQTKYDLSPARCWIDTVDGMPEDDDTNYTTIGLAILEKYGPDFSPLQVAQFWLDYVPILRTCTAERVAYRNLCRLILPPASASFSNPYREWIGAQIRADAFGYAGAGHPEVAAELAWRDASISHVKNGIYGEMWAAAMIAAAFATDDLVEVIEAGLAQIPARSRLHEAIGDVLSWQAAGMSYDDAVARIHARWDENRSHDWCHTISNAQVVAVALLWGELDYGRSICRAVQACFDTDCNGATVGSIIGAIVGASGIPDRWSAPVHDSLQTGIAGYNQVRISDMAARTGVFRL